MFAGPGETRPAHEAVIAAVQSLDAEDLKARWRGWRRRAVSPSMSAASSCRSRSMPSSRIVEAAEWDMASRGVAADLCAPSRPPGTRAEPADLLEAGRADRAGERRRAGRGVSGRHHCGRSWPVRSGRLDRAAAWPGDAHCVLPQAIRTVVPALVIQLTSLLKDSTLGYVLSYPELMKQGNNLTVYTHLLVQDLPDHHRALHPDDYALGQLAGWLQTRPRRTGRPTIATRRNGQGRRPGNCGRHARAAALTRLSRCERTLPCVPATRRAVGRIGPAERATRYRPGPVAGG